MSSRRTICLSGVGAALFAVVGADETLASTKRVVLVHGRSQQGRDPTEIKGEWLDALSKGAKALNREVPSDLDVRLPYYGDTLDKFARELDLPLASDIHERGGATTDEFLLFQATIAEEMRISLGVSDAELNAEYGDNPREKGPLNWEWVQAIIRAIDKRNSDVSQKAIEMFLRDVFLYTTRSGVRDEIDSIVRSEFDGSPTIVVGHSLGSVVSYNVLRNGAGVLKIPLFVTVGSPLGIRAISKQLRPLRYPSVVDAWKNAYDPRDVVALNPLDKTHFGVQPPIENYGEVKNSTDNRHGISGYLSDSKVAHWITLALS